MIVFIKTMADFISRTDIILCWVIFVSLLYGVFLLKRPEKVVADYQHWISFVLSAVSILGGANAVLTNIYVANNLHNQSYLNSIYSCIGGLAVVCLSIKNVLLHLGYERILNFTINTH